MAAALHAVGPVPEPTTFPTLTLVDPNRSSVTPSGRRTGPLTPPDEPAWVSTDAIKDYLRRIRSIPLLTAEDEVRLARRIQAGLDAADALRRKAAAGADDDARDGPDAERDELRERARDGAEATYQMVRANLRLVVSIAKRYTADGLTLSDLIQEGNVGLIRAVNKFDYHRGCKFSTYATWWIRQAISRAIADQSRLIRIPVHALEALDRVNRVQRRLTQDLAREPTLVELAHALGASPAAIDELRRRVRQPLSLDRAVTAGADECFGDLLAASLAAPATQDPRRLCRELDLLLDRLPEREAYVLRLRYGLLDGTSYSYERIGGFIGRSRDRVRHIEAAALRHLRDLPETEEMHDFLVD